MATQLKTSARPKPKESLADLVKPYLPEIAKRASATEAARMVPKENIDIIRKVGFVRALVPGIYGGDERDLWDFCSGVRAVVKACPSTGWVTGVANIHQVGIPLFDPSLHKEIWESENGADTIIVSSGTPIMKGKLVDGGIVVSGRGRWSSGCDHSEWAMVGVKVPNLADAQYPERNFAQYMFLAHRSEYAIDDTWYSMGMRGSGSKDLLFDNLFVPARRMERLEALSFGYSRGFGTIDSRVARFPFTMVFPTFLPAVALGCADGMIEEYMKRQRTRKNNLTGAYGIHNHASYMRLAESEHELDSLSNYYKLLLSKVQAMGDENRLPVESEFWGILAQFNFVTDRVTDIIERLFRGAGASAIADFNPMQRYWRDAHAARLHLGSDYDTSVQHHGRYLIGLPPTSDL